MKLLPLFAKSAILLCLIFSSCSNNEKMKNENSKEQEDLKNSDPVKIAQDFYDYVNKGDFESAKSISSPSTIEIIDEISQYKMVPEEKKFILMEVKKKDKYKEGDTVIVNYKVGISKQSIELYYSDGEFKVIPTSSIVTIRKFMVNSIDLYNGNIGGKKFTDATYKKIEDYRMVVKNLLIKNTFVGIGNSFAYDPINNFTPVDKTYKYYNGTWGPVFTDNRVIKLNDNNVNLIDCCTDDHYGSVDEYTNLSIKFISEEEAQKIEPSKNEREDSEENPLVDYFTHIYTVEGVFYGKNSLKSCMIIK